MMAPKAIMTDRPYAALTCIAVLCSVACFGGQPGDWRTYEVYQPTVTRHAVIDGATHAHKYNHCPTIAWFQDRWFCIWGSHLPQIEHAPGQRIVISTSPDGRTWTPIERLFSSPEHCENPVLYPEGKGHQWQPNLGVVEGELWVLWNQGGSAHDFIHPNGERDQDIRGVYLSRLSTSGGKWTNRRLRWDGRNHPLVDGRQFNLATTQDLYRLRSGRVLAPVSLYGGGKRAEDAPDKATGWWGLEKTNSVIYTDDLGATWHLSPGCQTPGLSWVQWEPTVWEQPDGSVMMFARNNTNWNLGLDKPTSGQYLLWSISHDQGETWTPHRYVPMESVCSRMHVVPLDGRGVWAPTLPNDNFTGRRYVMVHNDAPGGVYSWPAARSNLALFFARGHGVDFVAGSNISQHLPRVAYPQMWRHDDTLGICYSTSETDARSIFVSLVSPLPRPDRYYLFPRFNDVPRPEAPVRSGNAVTFPEGLPIAMYEPIDPGPDGLSFGTWIRDRGVGVLLDTRGADGGFVIMLKSRLLDGETAPRVRRPEVCLLTEPHDIGSSLHLSPQADWHYIGLTADNRTGEATFYVDGQSETVHYRVPLPRSLRGISPCLGAKSLTASGLSGLRGDMRFAGLYAGTALGPQQHRWLYNRFAAELGKPLLANTAEPAGKPLMWMDPADEAAFARDFALPSTEQRGGSEMTTVDGRPVLRLRDHASVGVDLDENQRERGDTVSLRFQFRLESGDNQTLCTIGDFNRPVRLVARAGRVLLCAGTQETFCGPVNADGWTPVTVASWDDRARAQVGDGAPVEVSHQPEATWVYLGNGFPQYGEFPGTRWLIDIASVRTRVVHAPRE